MVKYVALLRGVNVGGRIIKMAELKACFEKMGFSNVATVLQTGNVIFESDQSPQALKSQIETSLGETFGYPAKAQVLSLSSLATIIKDYPFDTSDKEKHNYIVFLEGDLSRELYSDAAGLDENVEGISAGQGVVYWSVLKGMTLKSDFAKLLTKPKYKEFNTNRNLNTLKRLV